MMMEDDTVENMEELGTTEIPPEDQDVLTPAPAFQPQNTIWAKFQRLFPRACVKVIILIFGVVVILVGVLNLGRIIFSLFSGKGGGDTVDLILGIMVFPFMLVGGLSFITSSVMKKKRLKLDRIISTIAIISFTLLCILGVISIGTKTILGVYRSLTLDEEDLENSDKEKKSDDDPDGGGGGEGRSVEDMRTFLLIFTIIIGVISCCCCLFCCAPCLIMSYVNCAHTFPDGSEEVDDDDVDEENSIPRMIEIPETGGFGELLDEDEDEQENNTGREEQPIEKEENDGEEELSNVTMKEVKNQ